ncbi:hypothetical protein GCM10027578_08750 [Spirosoma luteolum]
MTYRHAFQIGIIAGMRSMMAPALVSHQLTSTPAASVRSRTLRFMHAPLTATLLKAAALGELIGDKMPAAPNRIAFPAILGRLGSGALAGATLAGATLLDARPRERSYGALAGVLGAAVGSYGFFYLRRWLTTQQTMPALYAALAEDALAIGAGYLTVRQAANQPLATQPGPAPAPANG